MKPVDLKTVSSYCGGELIAGDPAACVSEVSTDSREDLAGKLFVALAGERFDGHSFVKQAAASGVTAVLVHQIDSQWLSLGCGVIKCDDTLSALQSLSGAYRDWHDPHVVSITGSNGKTSTKDFISATLSPKYHVRATAGNLNNHIGLPLSLLSLREGDDCGVFEIGMNHPGEIAPLAALAKPDGAVITNIGVAHIEYMGSREAIALEKGMLAEAVSPSGFVVLNADDEFTPSIAARTAARVVRAGLTGGDVVASELSIASDGTRFTVKIEGRQWDAFVPVPGQHMVVNATLALGVAWQSGVAIDAAIDALANASITKGRLDVRKLNGVTFIDDSYNANPDSMKAGLSTLAGLECEGRRVAVLGRMGELGVYAESGHAEVGEHAASLGLDAVFTVGAEADRIARAASAGCGYVSHHPNHEECAVALGRWLLPGDLVLVKGSRSSAMEKVINLLQNA